MLKGIVQVTAILSVSLLVGIWWLKPASTTAATTQSGMISGVVSPGSSHSTVSAYSGSDTVSVAADSTGAFMLMPVPIGTYSVHIMPADPSVNDTTIAGVGVTDGSTTNLGTIQLSSK